MKTNKKHVPNILHLNQNIPEFTIWIKIYFMSSDSFEKDMTKKDPQGVQNSKFH